MADDWKLRRGKFLATDLRKIDASKCVIFRSGGPLMDVEAVEGDQVLCSWPVSNQGSKTRERHLFKAAVLARLVPYVSDPPQPSE